MATNEDDLYDDLEDDVAKPMTSNTRQKNTSSMSKSLSVPPLLSHPEVAQLQKQTNALKVENNILKKNMGILYITSKSELERKDRTIDQLQNEIDSLRR